MSAKAAGYGSVGSYVVFLLSAAAELAANGAWWALPLLPVMFLSGVLGVVLMLVWGASLVSQDDRRDAP